MAYSEDIKPTPKKIDTTTITDVVNEPNDNNNKWQDRILYTKRWGLYFPCYTDSKKTKLAWYRAVFPSKRTQNLKFLGTDFNTDESQLKIFSSLYWKTSTPTTCDSKHTLIDNFIPYIGAEAKKIIKSIKKNQQFLFLEKHKSHLFDSNDVYYAKNESSEKRAILLFPLDVTKLLIDENGKLTFNSVSNPPPEIDRLVEE